MYSTQSRDAVRHPPWAPNGKERLLAASVAIVVPRRSMGSTAQGGILEAHFEADADLCRSMIPGCGSSPHFRGAQILFLHPLIQNTVGVY